MTNSNIYRFSVFIIFAIITLYQVNQIVNDCGGNYIYPLDDTYIHLSIANNFAEHGIWGVTEHSFSSSSSSVLYTIVLSVLIFILGNNQLLPLAVNFITAYFIFNYIFSILKPEYIIDFGKSKTDKSYFIWMGFLASVITFLIIFSIPLIILTQSGMEHNLQILINLIFMKKTADYLSDSSKRDFQWMLILAMLTTAVRFEGLFLILIAMIFLVIKKDYKKTFYIFAAGLVPLIIYGIISYSNGWMPVPNSILLKSTKPETFNLKGILAYPFSWVMKLSVEPHLLTIFITAGCMVFLNFRSRRNLLEGKNFWLITTLFLIILQLTFGRTGWVYRYEAYIVIIGLTAIALNLADIIKFGDRALKTASIVLISIMLLVCISRSFKSIDEVNTMSVNIYEQQYQMSRFLNKFYNNSNVVLGDIGACTYFTKIHLLDLVSLGSMEPLQLRIARKFNADEIEKLAARKKMKIAIIYKEAFDGYIPESWIEAGTWKISNNIACYKDNVTFYAIAPEEFINLKLNLEKFKRELPVTVRTE